MVDNIDPYDLGTASIAGAVTDSVLTAGVSAQGVAQAFLDRLGGMRGCNIEANFIAGNGLGSTAIVRVYTRFNGVNWINVARFDFTTSNMQKIISLSDGAKTVTQISDLSAEGVRDGILGPDWRALLTTTGTYGGNASIALRLQPRF